MTVATPNDSLLSLRRKVERLRWGPDASQIPRLVSELIRHVQQLQEKVNALEAEASAMKLDSRGR
jgi:hypothetical protein